MYRHRVFTVVVDVIYVDVLVLIGDLEGDDIRRVYLYLGPAVSRNPFVYECKDAWSLDSAGRGGWVYRVPHSCRPG